MHTLALLLALVSTSLAGTWSKKEIDPKVLTDVTAYTIEKKQWQIGVFDQDYGLLRNVSIGTTLPFYVVGMVNAHAKVTAIQTPKFDAALEAAWYRASLAIIDLPTGTMTITPVGWKGSWLVRRKWSLHFGHNWTMIAIRGDLPASKIVEAVSEGSGADIEAALLDTLDEKGVSTYAGARLTLLQFNTAFDYRLNRRDSIVLANASYVSLHGLIAAGIATGEEGGKTSETGISQEISTPLKNVPSTPTLSWQWSWRRAHLRAGIPLSKSANVLFWIPQAFELYWILGPVPDR